MADSQPTTVHAEFNASDADLVVESSDNVQFKLHRKYLGAHTGAFPGPGDTALDATSRGDVTRLTEPAEVLELLFQFVYPKRQPALDDLKYEILGPLAEAAGKYEVFSVITICSLQLRRFISTHGPEVLGYAVKHDCPRLANETALYLMRDNSQMSKVAEYLPAQAMVPWLRFYEAWRYLLEKEIDAYSYYLQRHFNSNEKPCDSCSKASLNLAIHAVIDHQLRVYGGADIFHKCSGCTRYERCVSHWKDNIRHSYLLSLTDFLAGKTFDKNGPKTQY